MIILYSGPLTYGHTCQMRREAIERLGFKTIPIDIISLFSSQPKLLRKIQRYIRFGPMIKKYNEELNKNLVLSQAKVIWVDKALFIKPEFYKSAINNGIKSIVHYSPDNYFLKQNSSRHLWESLPFFSLVVTTKKNNVEKLKSRGAKEVFLSGNAFDPEIHRPVKLTEDEYSKYGSDISFIGRWEPEREALMLKLIDNGFDIKIWSIDWKKAKNKKVRSRCTFKSPMGLEYAKVINASKVNLGLLSKYADDTITQRSVEIPACASFMLAERTEEHLQHFQEGTEAEYFSNDTELIEKINFYLLNDSKRNEIAANGFARCISSKYSYDDRMKEIMQQL